MDLSNLPDWGENCVLIKSRTLDTGWWPHVQRPECRVQSVNAVQRQDILQRVECVDLLPNLELLFEQPVLTEFYDNLNCS